jgi:hypothetical protein
MLGHALLLAIYPITTTRRLTCDLFASEEIG